MLALRYLLYALMGAVLAAGWAFFYLMSGTGDLAAVDAAHSSLHAMRAIDSRWNDQLVAARATSTRFEPAPHLRPYSDLEVRTLRVTYPGVGLALAGVKNAFEEKAVTMRLAARGEKVFDAALLSPTGPRMDVLSRVLDRAFDDAYTWAEIHRSWLLYYTVFLIIVMAYAMRRIGGSPNQR